MSQDLTRIGEGMFAQTRRGYDRDQVDSYIGQLQQQVRELQVQLNRRTTDVAVQEALDQVGNEVADILKQANTTRDGILSTAQREADQLRRDAEAHAAHVTSVAEERVRQLDEDTDRIWVERERIVADARDLSRQLSDLADLAAQRFPNDPEDSEEEVEIVDGELETAEVRADPASGFEDKGPDSDPS